MGVFTEKTQEEIVNGILIEIVVNVDEVTDVNVGSVLRSFVEAISAELYDLYIQLDNVYQGTRIDYSTGIDLDNLGELVGVVRKQGTKSEGNVSFIRRTPALGDFTIPAGTIVSTQPNTAEEQLRFVVSANTTFSATIAGESNKFVNGIYDYALDERFISSISSLTGTAGGGGFTFTEGVDFQVIRNVSNVVIDVNTIVECDACDATTDWNSGAGATAIALDNADFKQGTGSLKLGKSTAGAATVYYDKTLGSVKDATGRDGFLWIYVNGAGTLAKINYLTIAFGSGGSSANSFSYKLYQRDLAIGWNPLKIPFNAAETITQGFPNHQAMNYLRFTITTNLATDTMASGDLKMDYWIVSESQDYVGDAVQFIQTGTLPDTGTNFLTSYVPLSKEALCDSEAVGTKYNVNRMKILYKVSFIVNVDSVMNYVSQSGGTDVEADDDLRERIKNAVHLASKATAEALRQNILAIEGIISVVVDDMPSKTKSNEAHTHISFAATPSQALDFEVAQDDPDFEITGTRGGAPVTFVKNTDYYISDSEVFWVDDAKNPDNSTIFYTDYNYRWLGHVEIFVIGSTIPLPPAIGVLVTAAIDDTRSAGIDATWAEPTVVPVNVDVDIAVDVVGGHTFTTVSAAVKSVIEDFLNAKDIGSDVYLAEIIDQVMETPGVINVVVNVPAADVLISSGEVARAGTVTVGSL